MGQRQGCMQSQCTVSVLARSHTRDEFGKVLLLLSFIRIAHDLVDAEVAVSAKGKANRSTGTAELLCGHKAHEGVSAEAQMTDSRGSSPPPWPRSARRTPCPDLRDPERR